MHPRVMIHWRTGEAEEQFEEPFRVRSLRWSAIGEMAIRLAVGYQLPDEDEPPFADLIADYREHIAELYFPWLNMPSGRSPISVREGFTDWEAQAKLEEDLRACRKLGIRLDLLLNANCYGALSLSQELENYTLSVIEHLGEVAGLDLVPRPRSCWPVRSSRPSRTWRCGPR